MVRVRICVGANVVRVRICIGANVVRVRICVGANLDTNKNAVQIKFRRIIKIQQLY